MIDDSAGEIFRYRRLKTADAEAMAALERRCFSLPWTLDQCAGALGQSNFAAFGQWRNGALLAYISFYHARPELEIVNLGVAPEERRKGYGLKILSTALQAGRKMGMEKAWLEVRETNVAAIKLYEKCGFRRRAVRRGYYPDNGESALIYYWSVQA